MGGMRRRWPLTGSSVSSALARWTQPGFIKSVQRGSVTIASGATTNTATINSIDVNNARLKFLGCNDAGSDVTAKALTRIALTNATTITASVSSAPTANLVTGFEIIEFYPGVIKSVQRGTITILAGNTSNTGTITTLNPAKSEVSYLGATVTNGALDLAWITLTNATTITATNNVTAAGNVIIGYEVSEGF